MKKNNKILIIFSWLLVVGVIILIFSFALQNPEASNSISDEFIKDTIGSINNGETLDTLEKKYTWDKISEFVRSLAHFFEYCLLGIVLFNALYLSINKPKYFVLICSVFSSIVIASIDEIAQKYFDRVSSIGDVVLDTFGALIGGALILFIYSLIEKHIKNKKECIS